jgi:predicted small lipoprotein YifL
VTARRAGWIGLCLVILATAACGLKGEPLPPEPAETAEPE